ncbi:expressed unknown protein [Seminavis robusta]|uniref:Uncharacterized protein n=1 Tax=Seminavis robusta TaxID=568900 RepID=A0A9N8DLP9_9STRA|nr:expressed unknown protein [Seminavis robusta]|eukprot:Sro228_g092840.1 n/a (317) ;mRNA; f:85804-86754
MKGASAGCKRKVKVECWIPGVSTKVDEYEKTVEVIVPIEEATIKSVKLLIIDQLIASLEEERDDCEAKNQLNYGETHLFTKELCAQAAPLKSDTNLPERKKPATSLFCELDPDLKARRTLEEATLILHQMIVSLKEERDDWDVKKLLNFGETHLFRKELCTQAAPLTPDRTLPKSKKPSTSLFHELDPDDSNIWELDHGLGGKEKLYFFVDFVFNIATNCASLSQQSFKLPLVQFREPKCTLEDAKQALRKRTGLDTGIMHLFYNGSELIQWDGYANTNTRSNFCLQPRESDARSLWNLPFYRIRDHSIESAVFIL